MSILSVALSVAVMNISLATLKGFSDEIRQKIRDINGDFIIDSGENIEEGDPILIDNQTVASLNGLNKIVGVDKVVQSSAKACILKSEDEMEGLIAKGVSHISITDVLKNFGTNPIPQNEKNWCVISKTTSKRLNLAVGDEFTIVIFKQTDTSQNIPKARRLKVSSLFETGIDKIDQNTVFVEHAFLAQFLPQSKQFSNIEIWLKPNADKVKVRKKLLLSLPNSSVRLNSIEDYNRQIFDWLSILNTNIVVILTLMALVAITTMCTTLLILVIERTSFIGLMLAMGTKMKDLQKVFIYQAIIITSIGVVLGNLITLFIATGQNYFHWISLNQEIYFIKHVTLKVTLMQIFLVDVGAIILIFGCLFLPVRYVRKTNIIKAITFK